MNLRRIGFIACLLPTLTLGLDFAAPSRGGSLTRPINQTLQVKREIDNIFEATNAVRAAKSRALLHKDPKLMTAAQQYAELMAARDEMSHTIGGLSLVDKAQRVGYVYRTVRENIALNTDLDGQFVVYEQWMKSKGHRQNMLANDISDIGIGVAGPSKRTKRYYYCQIFGAPLSNQ